MEFGYPFGLEDITNSMENFIAEIKMMKTPVLKSGRGIIKDFTIPSKIRIDESYEVSAPYQGSVKFGYFSLLIVDRDYVKQWFPDSNSVGRKLLDSGESVQTGILNFSNGLYESEWKFTPSHPLYAGYAKAIIHMFEDTNVYPLTFHEKDIHLI